MLDETVVRVAARESASEIARQPISDGQCLISTGLIDSLSVVKLIDNLERRLHVEIPTENLQPEDFDNLQLIVETVQRVARTPAG